jgi:uncharacterized protein with HEPN domain
MLDGCRFVEELTRGKTIDDYKRDRTFRSALERELQNIGEALRQLEAKHPETAAKLSEHEKIVRFRHALVHGYDEVKPRLVWDVVEAKIPVLLAELETLLGSA